MATKTCRICGETKELDQFYRSRTMKDGRDGRCKECNCAVSRKRNREKAVEIAIYDAERNKRPDRRLRSKASVKVYRLRYPDRRKANNAAHWAISHGTMTRPDTCSKCGKACKPVAHHEDYSKPLDVWWLCLDCHLAIHGRGCRTA